MESLQQASEALLHAQGLNTLCLELELNAKRRPQVRTLHYRAAHPHIPRQIRQPQRIVESTAAGISYHRVSGSFIVVIIPQFREVLHIFELAIPVGSIHRKSPIAVRLTRGTPRQSDQESGDVFSGEPIANVKLFRGPRLRHLLEGRDFWILLAGMRQHGFRIRSGRRNFDLWRRLSRRQF